MRYLLDTNVLIYLFASPADLINPMLHFEKD